jgi:hypothetical protein
VTDARCEPAGVIAEGSDHCCYMAKPPAPPLVRYEHIVLGDGSLVLPFVSHFAL